MTNPRTWIVRVDLNHNGHDDLVIDFGKEHGVWAYLDDARWQQVHGTTARGAIVADLDRNQPGRPGHRLRAAARHLGIHERFEMASDSRRIGSAMLRADLDHNGGDDLVVDFGPKFGIWVFNNNSKWTQLHGQSANSLTAVDIDHDGRDDLVVDFGPSHGIWSYLNGSRWTPLHGASARQVVAADLDANGQADLVVDFGKEGIWRYMNGAEWSRLSAGGARMMAGEFDGR